MGIKIKLKKYLIACSAILLGIVGGLAAGAILEWWYLRQLKKKGYTVKCYIVKNERTQK